MLTSKVKGIKTTPVVRNQTHKAHHPSPRPRSLSRKAQGEKTGSAVPLYLVTTAALTLRGSWKLTVRDVLLVTRRQTLAGTSGAPDREGK